MNELELLNKPATEPEMARVLVVLSATPEISEEREIARRVMWQLSTAHRRIGELERERDAIAKLLENHVGETLAEKVECAIQIANDVVGDARLLYDMEEFPGKVEMVKNLRDSNTRIRELEHTASCQKGSYIVGKIAGVWVLADVKGSTSGANMVRAHLSALQKTAEDYAAANRQREEAEAKLAESEAGAAAMRLVLKRCAPTHHATHCATMVDRGCDCFFGEVQSALSSNSGSAISERLKLAESSCAVLRNALEELWTFQNGCPLPSYEKGWGNAMKLAEAALDAAKVKETK